jgi:3-hydroxymyristoyl/3-hydroxydecanoyl-(acyl carrier protein) dehydratases
MITVRQALQSSFKGLENGEFVFFIDENFPAFEGHFPDAPILPGIVQAEMALFCIRRMLGENVNLFSIKKAKFSKPVMPGTEIFVSVRGENDSYLATIKNAKEIFSQISIIVK